MVMSEIVYLRMVCNLQVLHSVIIYANTFSYNCKAQAYSNAVDVAHIICVDRV